MTIIARHLIIRGRVQGVFFRGWTVETARKLGLSGWVRNRADGTVEAVAEGDAAAVESFLVLARDGPRAARVDAVDAIPVPPSGREGFEQRATI